MSMVSASFAPFQGYCIELSSNRPSGRSRAPIIIIFPLLSPAISGSVLGGGLAVMKLSYQYLSICRCIANFKVCVRESTISYHTIQLPYIYNKLCSENQNAPLSAA